MITAIDVSMILGTIGFNRIPSEVVGSWSQNELEDVHEWATNLRRFNSGQPRPEVIRFMQNEVLKFILRDLEYLEGVCDAVRNDRGVNRINQIRNNLKRLKSN